MCGIFAYNGKKINAGEIVISGLRMLEYRGYDSWGVALKRKKGKSTKSLLTIKRTGKIGKIKLSKLPSSSFAFGHTRWATHGGITVPNAHPHLDCRGNISLIHNGIIENYQELKIELLEKGHKFISETDSEVAVHLIEEYRKNYAFTEAVRRCFIKLAGLNAIIAMDAKADKFVVARNGSPVVIGFGNGENLIASDAQALLPHTRDIYFLKDYEIAEISDEAVNVRDVKSGKKKTIKKLKLKWSVEETSKGGYPHFMIKEIFEQPALIEKISGNRNPAYACIANLITEKSAILIGCGSASYACLAGTYIFSKVAKHRLSWVMGSEFEYYAHQINSDSLVVALSQSGETADILEAVKVAKKKKATIAAIVNSQGSSLYRLSDYQVMLQAGPEKAVASTKAFIAKLASLIKIAYELKGETKNGKQLLLNAAASSRLLLKSGSLIRIKHLATNLRKKDHIYVVGRGLSYPASLETALKIKEISYIHAEGFAAGELKHGVIALIEKGTPCIVFLPDDEAYGANLAGAMEMKARGAHIIGVSHKVHEIFDDYFQVADAGEATIIPNVIFGQLLAYELALAKKLDPDMPRNLAKSVTVK